MDVVKTTLGHIELFEWGSNVSLNLGGLASGADPYLLL